MKKKTIYSFDNLFLFFFFFFLPRISFPVPQASFGGRVSQWVRNGGGASFADDVGFTGANFAKSRFFRATFKTVTMNPSSVM